MQSHFGISRSGFRFFHFSMQERAKPLISAKCGVSTPVVGSESCKPQLHTTIGLSSLDCGTALELHETSGGTLLLAGAVSMWLCEDVCVCCCACVQIWASRNASVCVFASISPSFSVVLARFTPGSIPRRRCAMREWSKKILNVP